MASNPAKLNMQFAERIHSFRRTGPVPARYLATRRRRRTDPPALTHLAKFPHLWFAERTRTVRTALSRRGLTNVRRGTMEGPVTLAEGERFAVDLARELCVQPHVIYSWIKSGRLPGRKAGSPQGRWIVQADAKTVANLKTAVAIRPSDADSRRSPGKNREGVTGGAV